MNVKDTILQAEKLTKTYTLGKASQQVLRGVSLRVARGEFLAIMGASGSGKSTLLHILGLLDQPDQGKVWFEKEDVFGLSSSRQNHLRNQAFGFVFQFYHLLPELNVLENVMLPGMVGCPAWHWMGRRVQLKQDALQVIENVGLTNQLRQKPATLSGGERQRVALARALVGRPKVLLADEPTGNLDSQAGGRILDLLCRLNQQGQTVIMVTHDAAVAQQAHRRLVLADGKLG
ncbi:MAG: ABC transporter ATP-binding protein [Sedimentisphaerales bacterium]|nr:ABC transporter ATP-binding protein [Sedimentisphaerales bacterium]